MGVMGKIARRLPHVVLSTHARGGTSPAGAAMTHIGVNLSGGMRQPRGQRRRLRRPAKRSVSSTRLKAKKRRVTRSGSVSRSSRRGKLRKGSAAAKAHMKRLRGMQKRRR